MNWFRSNIRHGARLALLALAIQSVLSFGHFHAIAAARTPQASIGTAAASLVAHVESASRDEPRSNPDSDQATDLCAICAVVAMVNTAVPAPGLPPLQLPDAVNLLRWHLTSYAAPVETGRRHFQPRAPPIS